ATDFDANGNLLTLNNIGTLNWHYNNTLNKFTKDNKNTATEYYVYDYQGNRVRTVLESNQQIQSQRDYLPSLDILTNKDKQQTNTLHIGTHILSETTKNNPQTRYQLSSHLHSNTLELNDKAQTISYEHFYPYGATALIAGINKPQVQKKRYRYTNKERDDSSGLSYYSARYLAPWLTRWIAPDSAGTINGLNLYAYVDNNPLKYLDPTGHGIETISMNEFLEGMNNYTQDHDLNVWIGERHDSPEGNRLLLSLAEKIKPSHIGNVLIEAVDAKDNTQPAPLSDAAEMLTAFDLVGKLDMHLSQAILVANARIVKQNLIGAGPLIDNKRHGHFVGKNNWSNPAPEVLGITGGLLATVGISHILRTKKHIGMSAHQDAYPLQDHLKPNSSIALIPRKVLSDYIGPTIRNSSLPPELGLWIRDENNTVDKAFLAISRGGAIKSMFGNKAQPIPIDLKKSTSIKTPLPYATEYNITMTS
ncbi:MAG: RHS repeat-associated core domain-containing protein, partial [Gammaproteobacteria bacterium]|nr:RHS repeat-associated core domain-containing protein [Gammaproteobacteria bacterium]